MCWLHDGHKVWVFSVSVSMCVSFFWFIVLVFCILWCVSDVGCVSSMFGVVCGKTPLPVSQQFSPVVSIMHVSQPQFVGLGLAFLFCGSRGSCVGWKVFDEVFDLFVFIWYSGVF